MNSFRYSLTRNDNMPALFSLETGLILQKLHTALSNNYDLILVNKLLQPKTENENFWVDVAFDAEIVKIKGLYQQEENRFVEQMLIVQPPKVSFRRNAKEFESKNLTQQQKAESCRRSRLNGKIKKAKTFFRHQFISEKLSKSSNFLQCIHNLVAIAENKLLESDFDQNALAKLRGSLNISDEEVDIRHYATT